MASRGAFQLNVILVLALAATAFSTLSPYYYQHVCPEALPTIKRVVEVAVYNERRMGASLLRLHFHDCFVNGCDASLLLDSTSTIDSEKNSRANQNSTRGFEVIDQIKIEVDKICGRPVFSCADILAVAARDSVVAYLPALIENFKRQGLDERDLVALSGGHTLGFAQCFTFRERIYNETNIDDDFAEERRKTCPRTGGNTTLAPLDPSPARFDTAYFNNLVKEEGLLHSDQALFNGGSTDELVKAYSENARAFSADFAKSMVKMGNIKVLTGEVGQIRLNCRNVIN
ncbi:hypothetical protein LWI29_019321 [Acer saccharum]|uniref:Peroxidase n=1 Tax=Acer saccharum TaxID=4024 RepID=A0AA39S4B4_ACESA|nr:hypothetical protein LWI29_019321 [Acer saccharum]